MATASLVTIPLLSEAVVAVQWGPDTNVTGGGFGINLSPNSPDPSIIDLTDPGNPDPATNGGTYYPNNTNSRSPVFFYTGVANAGELDNRIINNTAPATSEMRLGIRDTDGGDGFVAQGANLVLWTQTGFDYASGPDHGFLNGYDSTPATLESINSSWATNGGTAAAQTTLYFIIRLGSDFYAAGGDSLSASTDLLDPAAATWYNYDPLTDIEAIGSEATLTNFDNLTAAGVMTAFDYTSGSAIYLNAELGEFQVNVVPEPQTYALIAGCTGLLIAIRRRQKRS
ncbi:hypothetical protein [Cerasicoccus fimbriatus]|uniref:hypothetical protein n=1 Tax=Cerasicoccus fimbriatus TaxID=3014554 RepID=UPI0022B2ADE7|nr:hypothetical protein [Cerasicoccus sp. TK19100]